MFLMSTSLVLCQNFIFINSNHCRNSLYMHNSSCSSIRWSAKKQRFCGFIPNAKNNNNHSKRNKSWWQRFFFDDDGNWLGLKDNDMFEEEADVSSDEELSESEKFEAWKRRAEAIIELREAQEDMRNEESRRWEDWIVDDHGNGADESWNQDLGNGVWEGKDEARLDPSELFPERGLVESVRDLVFGKEEDDILYEDRIFRYASLNSIMTKEPKPYLFLLFQAKFLAVLIIIPWALDFVVHDYVLMPFLDR
ncbi:hypothetical protein Pint_13890 [Pistacia integerrima]|uniref:Uncharacterized protein n=1 Tax=Pistacia integerrima TaxID=434235 RepID=A0ACC0Y7I3_9ROSI|nr:hypothetical protein Pint_13890 [Pistacia integerrima]